MQLNYFLEQVNKLHIPTTKIETTIIENLGSRRSEGQLEPLNVRHMILNIGMALKTMLLVN